MSNWSETPEAIEAIFVRKKMRISLILDIFSDINLDQTTHAVILKKAICKHEMLTEIDMMELIAHLVVEKLIDVEMQRMVQAYFDFHNHERSLLNAYSTSLNSSLKFEYYKPAEQLMSYIKLILS